jgi:Ca2+:H+ antiporter
MSDAPDGPGAQSVDLPREQNQPPPHPLWYPSYATRATLASSYLNVLLVFVPIGIVAGALGWADVAVFFLNFLAMIPLAPLIALSTWELSTNVGWVFGGLLNIVLSNAVKTIVRHPCLSILLFGLTRLVFVKVGIIAVSRGEILIVQSALIGSILFESLLVKSPSFRLCLSSSYWSTSRF